MKENEIKLKNAKEKAIASINKSERFIVAAIDENSQEYTTACGFIDKLRAALFLVEDALSYTQEVPIEDKLATQMWLSLKIKNMDIEESSDDQQR